MPATPASADRRNNPNSALYPLLAELDRLEDLLELMDELGVATRAEAEIKLAALNARVDELSGE